VQKAAEWVKEYKDALAAGTMTDTVRYRYRHAEIKAALRRDSHNKCIYCESDIGFGQTDHINPVSKCPDEIVSWPNLALVCTECNTHKKDYYAPTEPWINPFVEEPSAHLLFLGPLVFPVPGDVLGFRTRERIKLNRDDLMLKRKKRLERLFHLIERWKTHPDGATKDILRTAIVDEAADAKDYAATVRAYPSRRSGGITIPTILRQTQLCRRRGSEPISEALSGNCQYSVDSGRIAKTPCFLERISSGCGGDPLDKTSEKRTKRPRRVGKVILSAKQAKTAGGGAVTAP
jgi:hypothetical protein